MGQTIIKNVLIVDDDPISAFLTKLILEDIGFVKDIFIESNGEDAYHFISNGKVQGRLDLILLDLNMPKMNGFEFLEVVNSSQLINPEQLKIVVLTSSTNEHDREMAYRYRVHDFLEKPLNEDKIKRFF
jgi:CheY-like chemotaxis protein